MAHQGEGRDMESAAGATQMWGRNVLRSVRWFNRAMPVALILAIAAILVQPPVSPAHALPVKADPVLFARAAAHPTQPYSVIVREARPTSSAAEDLVRSRGGHVTHELGIIGGFSAVVPGSA